MSVPPIPPMPSLTLQKIVAAPGLLSVKARNNGSQLIASQPGVNKWGNSPSGFPLRTSRRRYTALTECSDIELHYSNSAPGGGGALAISIANAPYSPFWLKASVLPMGATPNDLNVSRTPIFFRGKRWVKMTTMGTVKSDPISFNLGEGENFFVHTCTGGHPATPLAAPSLNTNSTTGGTIAAGTYQIIHSAIYPPYQDGPDETLALTSNVLQATTTGSTSSIVLNTPATPSGANAGAIGYNVYMTPAGVSASAGPYFLCNTAPIPFGTGYTITANPVTNFGSQQAIIGVPTFGILQTAWGEGITSSTDATDTGNIGGSDGFGYTPSAVNGKIQDKIVYSIAAVGDSKQAGSGSTGVAGVKTDTNGAAVAQWAYANNVPFVNLASGGEKAQNIANPAGWPTLQEIASLATHFFDNSCVNDLSVAGVTLSALQIFRLQMAQRAVQLGQIYVGSTLQPYTGEGTSVAWTLATGQTLGGFETIRVGFNNWWRSSASAQTAVSNETMTGLVNGSNRLFFASQAFDISQPVTVTINGNAAVFGTDYYWMPQYRAGKFVAGIQTVTAPSAGLVRIFYTSVPGGLYAASSSGLARCLDICTPVEVNASNVLTLNGGFWRGAGQQVANGTVTSTVNDALRHKMQIVDSGASFTPGALIGAAVRIGDPGALVNASGNSYIVYDNDATSFTITNSNNFANGLKYTLYGKDANGLTPFARDGLHGTQQCYSYEQTLIPAVFP